MTQSSAPLVVFGGPSPEHDISVLTGLQAARTMAVSGPVEAAYWSKAGRWFLVDPLLEAADFADGVPTKSRALAFVAEPGAGFLRKGRPLDVSVVVNCCHGGPGEDGTLQGAFDLAGLRYTGPGASGSALGMDKFAFGGAVQALGLPALPRILAGPQAARPTFPPPFIVKPRFGGSSIGIEVVEDWVTVGALCSASPHLRDGAVVEPFVGDSRDLQIGVRTFPELAFSAIEEPERTGSGGIYSYGQKYLAWGGGAAARGLPAEVDEQTAHRIRAAGRMVTELVGLRSLARIDFLTKGDQLWVNEVNTIPGSLGAYLWIDPPLSRAQLLADMVVEATKEPPRRFNVAGADGGALRSAHSIAQKLG